MLPFLKPRSQSGLIVSTRKPDGGSTESHMEGEEDSGLDACSEDLIRALHSKDTKGVSSALKAAFEILDSMSDDEESEPSEPDSE